MCSRGVRADAPPACTSGAYTSSGSAAPSRAAAAVEGDDRWLQSKKRFDEGGAARRALAPGVPEPASAACPGGNIGVHAALRVAAEEKREEEVPRTLSAFGRSDRLVKPSCMVS